MNEGPAAGQPDTLSWLRWDLWLVFVGAALMPQYLILATTMVAVDLVIIGAYTGPAAQLLGWLQTPRQQKILNRRPSGMFALAAAVLSLMRRSAA